MNYLLKKYISMNKIISSLFIAFIILQSFQSSAQECVPFVADNGRAEFSTFNGFTTPPTNPNDPNSPIILRTLLIFSEISPGSSGYSPDVSANWSVGQLPTFKDLLFDKVYPFPNGYPEGLITKFYYDASFGKFILLGDYLIDNRPGNQNKCFSVTSADPNLVVNQANLCPSFQVSTPSLTKQNFDYIEAGYSVRGIPKNYNSNGLSTGYDFVSFLFRNGSGPQAGDFSWSGPTNLHGTPHV